MPKSVPMSSFVIVFLLGCIAGGLLSRNLWGQVSSAPTPAAAASGGRYQLLVPSDNSQYVIDTQTGQVWYRFGNGVGSLWEQQGPDFSKARIAPKL